MTGQGPLFLVEVPPGRRPEREYGLAVLLADWLGAPYALRVVEGRHDTQIALAADPDGSRIVLPDVFLARETAVPSRDDLPSSELATMALPEWTGMDGRLPLLFPVDGDEGELIRRTGDRFELRLDLLGSLVFMLSRYEEQVEGQPHDAHGRFPASSSVLARSGWLQWPVLDMYLTVFVALARLAWPRLDLVPRVHEALILGHDVDHPSSAIRFRGSERLRIVAGDLIHRRDPGLAIRRAGSLVRGRDVIPGWDPFNTYDLLMRASEALGVASTFFFLTRETDVPDGSRYQPDEPWAKRLMAEIAARGHHVGLHGSYNSWDDATRLRAEWAALEDATGGLPPGVVRQTIRQHFLRLRAGVTWRLQAEAGLAMDESLGFADSIGYRAGTARSFAAFDLAGQRPLALRVQPLHVMDQTLIGYMSLDADSALDSVAEMRRRTQRYGGSFSVLWHNSSLVTRGVRVFHRRLLSELGR